MDGQQSRLTEWLFVKAKVALAVAIIKNRPSGMSGRQYAEDLASKLRSRDESWRKKAEELQQEVLRLRQELLMARVTPSSTTAADQSNTMDVSQDLFGPESAACSADLQLGSDSETPDLLLPDVQPAVASRTDPQQTSDSDTPDLLLPDVQPAGTSHQPSGDHRSPPGGATLPHVQFLQSLCALHRVEGDRKGLDSLWFGSDGDAGSVLVDSVCQLLDSVVAVCRAAPAPPPAPPPGPGDVVLQACEVAARAMDLFCSQRLPTAEFRSRVEASLRELTGMLLHSNQLSGLRAAEKLMEYLITLGSSSMSESFLIRHILSQISALADQLWQAFQGQEDSGLDKFPVEQYQNSCRLFWIVEELLQKSKVRCRVEVGVLSHLEERAFLLSNEFPLFSICTWRIAGLLTSP